MIPSDKLILLSALSFLLVFILAALVGATGVIPSSLEGGYHLLTFLIFLLGIISPLVVMAYKSKINDAIYRRNPQLKIDIQKREEEIKHKEPNDPWKNLGWWSIIAVYIGIGFAYLMIEYSSSEFPTWKKVLYFVMAPVFSVRLIDFLVRKFKD